MPFQTPEAERAYTNELVPIRYAGVLGKKLDKQYWELPHVAGMPLAFAVQDFHASMSMTWSRNGLVRYLYGYDHEPTRAPNGDLIITPTWVDVHRWGTKEVPSGFFRLPQAEHVSAVIFNSSATISKFNRIGLVAGFGSRRVRLLREGIRPDPDPNASEPKGFSSRSGRTAIARRGSREWTSSTIPRQDIRSTLRCCRGPHHRLRDDGQIESSSRSGTHSRRSR